MIQPISCSGIENFKSLKRIKPNTASGIKQISFKSEEINEIPKNWHLDNKDNPTKIIEHAGTIDRHIYFEDDRKQMTKFIQANKGKDINIEQCFHYYHPNYNYPTYAVKEHYATLSISDSGKMILTIEKEKY